MTVNDKLLRSIKQRTQKRTEFNYGILTADRYVKTIRDCVGSDLCYRYASNNSTSFQDVMDKAARTLTYSSPDMEVENRMSLKGDWRRDSPQWSHQWKQVNGGDIEIPPKTLMIVRHILTTSRKDRDGDILRTAGAMVDPKMLLLWQHVHTLPIGKMLAIAEHTPNKLSIVSAIVDMNDLCHDAATMIDAGMGRFSHGFRALEFDDLKEEEGETTSPGGYDIKKFEIMEASLVSVPANVDAETEEIILGLVEGGKLTSPLMKATGEQIRANRPISLTFNLTDEQVKQLTLNQETDDENQPGSRSSKGEGQKEGCTCSPEETDAKDIEAEETTPSDTEVKGYQYLTGSWEWIEKTLKQKAGPFLAAHGVDLRERFVWLAGTYADYGVICAESNYCDVADEHMYYRAAWMTGEDGEPMWEGVPEAVSVATTVAERSPLYERKQREKDLVGETSEDNGHTHRVVLDDDGNGSTSFDAGHRHQVSEFQVAEAMDHVHSITQGDLEQRADEELTIKAGRVLSARNYQKLVDVRDDLMELDAKESDMSRGGHALCDRCVTKLSEIIDSAGYGDEDAVDEVTVKDAIAVIVAEATPEDRDQLKRLILTLEKIEKSYSLSDELSTLLVH